MCGPATELSDQLRSAIDLLEARVDELHESALVDAAARFDPGTVSPVARHVEHCVDPDGSLADANKAHQRRNLSLSQTLDGVFILDGLLDNEGGATLQTALNALMHPRSEDDRSPGQRRADALVELARRQLDAASLPAVRGQRPHLTITATAETLRAVPGAPARDVPWGLPVPAETVRRLACDAALVTVLQDEEENPLAVGRALRTVSTAPRRPLVTRAQGCRFPGCDRPADWSDGHHIKHWADGGETDLKNLLLVCEGHHRKVHEGGWRLVFKGERVVAIPPKRLVFGEGRVIGIPSKRFEARLLQPA